jgi:hypothetical protein
MSMEKKAEKYINNDEYNDYYMNMMGEHNNENHKENNRQKITGDGDTGIYTCIYIY